MCLNHGNCLGYHFLNLSFSIDIPTIVAVCIIRIINKWDRLKDGFVDIIMLNGSNVRTPAELLDIRFGRQFGREEVKRASIHTYFSGYIKHKLSARIVHIFDDCLNS